MYLTDMDKAHHRGKDIKNVKEFYPLNEIIVCNLDSALSKFNEFEVAKFALLIENGVKKERNLTSNHRQIGVNIVRLLNGF